MCALYFPINFFLQNRGAHMLFDVRPLFGILGYIKTVSRPLVTLKYAGRVQNLGENVKIR